MRTPNEIRIQIVSCYAQLAWIKAAAAGRTDWDIEVVAEEEDRIHARIAALRWVLDGESLPDPPTHQP